MIPIKTNENGEIEVRIVQANSYPEPTCTMTIDYWNEVVVPPTYEERLLRNALANLYAYRETLRLKDLIVGAIYLAAFTALVLIVCFSL